MKNDNPHERKMYDESADRTYLQRVFQSFLLLFVYIHAKNLAAIACKYALKGLHNVQSAQKTIYIRHSLGTFRKSKAKAISVSCR